MNQSVPSLAQGEGGRAGQCVGGRSARSARLLFAGLLTLSGGAVPSLFAEDLTEAEVVARVSLDSAPARRLAASLRAQPVVFDGEIERRVRAEARGAFARLLAAQVRADTIEATLARVRDLASALARGEDAGDAAGFDRVQVERVVSDLQAAAADAADARARAQVDLAAYFAAPVDPRALRAVAVTVGARPALADANVLVTRALALAKVAPAAVATGRGRQTSAIPFEGAVPDAAADSRRAELRTRVLGLAAVVTDRRTATVALRQSAAADDLERIARVSYDNGIRTALELLAAHRAAVRTRLRVVDAELALRRAEIELEELIGETLP